MTAVLAHRGICVQDLVRSREFYTQALGFTEVGGEVTDAAFLGRLTGHPDPQLRTAHLREPRGAMFELVQYVDPPATGPRQRRALNELGTTHLCFWVDEIERAANRVEVAGGLAHWPTLVRSPEFATRVMYCSDPDGVRVELGQQAGQTPAFLHSGLCAADVRATIGFYVAVLGFRLIEEAELTSHAQWLAPLMELDEPRLAARVLANERGDRIEVLELYHPMPVGARGRRPPHRFGLSHMTFLVDSVPASAELATAHGATDARLLERDGDGAVAFACADPSGGAVLLVERGA
jgi:catechol 2,3-dioxygenase-like lactoylglutathione lyase family enzyme